MENNKSFIERISKKISKSLNGDSNEVSTPRLQSYILIILIVLMTLGVISIEIWSFVHSIRFDKEYNLSNEYIVVLGMILAHHISVLFSRNKPKPKEEPKLENIEEPK